MTFGKWIGALLKEPLLHFVLVGALAYGFLYDGPSEKPFQNQPEILISAKDQQRIASAWHKQWGRPPTDLEFKDSLVSEIRQRILFQEARALNLHVDDTIIQRRMVQKLEYIQEATGMTNEPVEARLQTWFSENRERYKAQPRVSFDQVFFDTDKRLDALGDAKQALSQILSGADPEKLGDILPYPNQKAVTKTSTAGTNFGENFTAKLLDVEKGRWTGPLTSGVGVHLVKVFRVTESGDVTLNDVRQRVLNDYMYARRKQILESQYDGIRGKYNVRIERTESMPDSTALTQAK